MTEESKPAPIVVRELLEEALEQAGKRADEIIVEVLSEPDAQEKE